MKYVLAIFVCVAICIAYALIGALLGWRSGGGVIPMMILFAALVATWRGITKNKATPINKHKHNSQSIFEEEE